MEKLRFQRRKTKRHTNIETYCKYQQVSRRNYSVKNLDFENHRRGRNRKKL